MYASVESAGMKEAEWIAGWYELDQSIATGMRDEFIFWRNVPDHLERTRNLVFHNDLWKAKDAIVGTGTISSIRHPELGAITSIDTMGLDYTITLASGRQLLVNAEEQPGKMYKRRRGVWEEARLEIDAWRFIVQLTDLTALEPDSEERRMRRARQHRARRQRAPGDESAG